MVDEKKHTLQIAIEVLLAAVLIYSPVAFGSAAAVYRPPIWIASTLLLGLTVYYLRRFGLKRKRGNSGQGFAPPLLSFWLFGGFLALLLFQLIPLPGAVTRWFTPEIPGASAPFLSIHPFPEQGLRAFLDWSSALILFFVVATVPGRRNQIKRIVGVLLAVAGFEAVYGMIEYAGGHQHIFTYAKVAYLDSATGTFINRNHFANYLMMAFCLNLGVVSYLWAKSKSKNPKGNPTREKIPLIVFYTVLIAAALLFSRSRGGLVCLLFGINIMALLSTRAYRRSLFVGLLVLAILVVGFSFWVGANPMPDRFLDLPAEVRAEDSRPEVWAESARLWMRSPVLGFGTGTFGDAFRALGGGKILARYLHAHNDYLEILVETGLVGFFLLFGGIGLVLVQAVRNGKKRNSRFARFYSQGMIAACGGMLLHSLMDFSLQIPANRNLFFVLLGLAYLTATRRMSR